MERAVNNDCEGCRWSNTIGGLCDECSRGFKDRYESDHKKKTNDDAVSRRMAVDAFMEILDRPNHAEFLYTDEICRVLGSLPPAQPEPAIPLQWIETQIELLKSWDNAFSTLTAVQISAMVNKWKGEQDR